MPDHFVCAVHEDRFKLLEERVGEVALALSSIKDILGRLEGKQGITERDFDELRRRLEILEEITFRKPGLLQVTDRLVQNAATQAKLMWIVVGAVVCQIIGGLGLAGWLIFKHVMNIP
ncbi:MAG: hypothetical protein WCI73_10280 [Phycisphaerae bacterium]